MQKITIWTKALVKNEKRVILGKLPFIIYIIPM